MKPSLYFLYEFGPQLVAELPAQRKVMTLRKSHKFLSSGLRAGMLIDLCLQNSDYLIGEAMITGLETGILTTSDSETWQVVERVSAYWSNLYSCYRPAWYNGREYQSITDEYAVAMGFNNAIDAVCWYFKHGYYTETCDEPVKLLRIQFALLHPAKARRDYLNFINI